MVRAVLRAAPLRTVFPVGIEAFFFRPVFFFAGVFFFRAGCFFAFLRTAFFFVARFLLGAAIVLPPLAGRSLANRPSAGCGLRAPQARRMLRHMKRFAWVLVLLLGSGAAADARDDKATKTRVVFTYDKEIASSFSGRIYLFVGRGPREPRFGPNWFQPQPFFSMDVKRWQAGKAIAFDPPFAFPKPLAELGPGTYRIQAVMRLSPHVRQVGRGEGNAYSAVSTLEVKAGEPIEASLHIDKVVPPPTFRETEHAKEHVVRSELLSTFHKRDVMLRAGVVLPAGYDPKARRRYPALYVIPGFGGRHLQAGQYARDPRAGHGEDIVRIVLDPDCGGGHHVFADSANNGPWGQALVEELIPSLESAFRLVRAPTARFLTGVSSGGWSSLWLQITYPDAFNGTWSFCPDPVDFRDFQRIDLYKRGTNMLEDEKGERRPLARHGGHVMVWYDDFVAMETVLGDGGQIRSFEWCFSPRGEDGKPLDLFDRETGVIDPKVARAWMAYDISLLLRNNWRKWKTKLKDKIRVFMGGKDTFYLDGATRLLAKEMKKVRSDAVIEIHEQHDHGSIVNRALLQRVDRELMERFKKAHPKLGR